MFSSFDEYASLIQSVVLRMAEVSPSLVESCVLHGTSPISCVHLKHAISMDLDFESSGYMENPKAVIPELKKGFGKAIEFYELDYEFGIFRGAVHLGKNKPVIGVDIMSNIGEIESFETETPSFFGGQIQCVNLGRYYRDKLLCLEGRREVKDLYHLYAIQKNNPEMAPRIDRALLRLEPGVLQEHQSLLFENWEQEKSAFTPISGMTAPSHKEFEIWMNHLCELSNSPNKAINTNLDKKPHVALITKPMPAEPADIGSKDKRSRRLSAHKS